MATTPAPKSHQIRFEYEGAEHLPARKGCLDVATLKQAHLQQGMAVQGLGNLKKFRAWAEAGAWERFGPQHSHYDWWMFPIPGASSKPEFMVGAGEVARLRQDPEFMANYREGVHLLFRSW